MYRSIIFVLFMTGVIAAQYSMPRNPRALQNADIDRLSGPRTGLTIVTGEMADRLGEEFDASPVITQFGWQFEKRVNAETHDLAFLSEFVPLVGGLEQGLFLPSLSWIFGVRGRQGREFGVGANLSLAGGAYVIAGGITQEYGNINIPINGSVVFARGGLRVSMLIGLNMLD